MLPRLIGGAALVAGLGALGCGDEPAPRPSAIERRFESIAAGAGATCAADDEGRTTCWGRAQGPRDVRGAPPLSELAVGRDLACGRSSDAGFWCWSVVDPDQVATARPELGADPVVLRLGRSGELCVVQVSGELRCSGGAYGSTPVAVGTSRDFLDVSLGERGIVARRANGWIVEGALGSTAEPTRAPGLLTLVREVSAGDGFACTRTTVGILSCWGRDDVGQLGRGEAHAQPQLEPAQVAALGSRASGTALGTRHALSLEDGGRVSTWGANDAGQLGVTPGGPRATPERIDLPAPAARVAAGSVHGVALDVLGRLWCWGGDPEGACPGARDAPVRLR